MASLCRLHSLAVLQTAARAVLVLQLMSMLPHPMDFGVAAAPVAAPTPTPTPLLSAYVVSTPLPLPGTTTPPPDLSTSGPALALLPTPADSILTSYYAVGTVRFDCNQAGDPLKYFFATAYLYSTQAPFNRVGAYVNANYTQTFLIENTNTTGSAVITLPGNYVPAPTGTNTNWEWAWSPANGTDSLANVRYITQTNTTGGLPNGFGGCSKVSGPNIAQDSWEAPIQAVYTFYTMYKLPRSS